MLMPSTDMEVTDMDVVWEPTTVVASHMLPEAHKDSVERDLPNLFSDTDHTDMELEMELLLSTQPVPHSPPEAHKDSVERDLPNLLDMDSTTMPFLETLSSPDLE